MDKSFYFRCIFDWYRRQKLIDLMAVGGSGGHFSPEYFDYIRIPKFPDSIIDEIISLYSTDDDDMYVGDDLNQVLSNDIKAIGIVQLDKTIKSLKSKLNRIIDNIIEGKLQSVEKLKIAKAK